MARGFGTSASGKACKCNPKDKNNWFIIGRAGQKKTIECIACHAQWDTTAKYVNELKKANYLK